MGTGTAVAHLHQRHSVAAPDLPERAALREQGGQPVAVGRHRLRADGMQRHQDVVAPLAEAADPVLRCARSGVAHECRAFGRSGDECAERLERERGNADP